MKIRLEHSLSVTKNRPYMHFLWYQWKTPIKRMQPGLSAYVGLYQAAVLKVARSNPALGRRNVRQEMSDTG